MQSQASHEKLAAFKVLTSAIQNLAREWELKNIDLAALVGVSPGTITKLYDGRYHFKESSNEGQRALFLLRIYRSLSVLVGNNREHMVAWLKSSNKDLGAIPLEAMKELAGLVHVAEYLDSMRGKV